MSSGHQVLGQVAQDPEPGLERDVAELATSGTAVAVPLVELCLVERDDRRA
jgi:hypothetical protein